MEIDYLKWELISFDEENDVMTMECEHSILIVEGSPSPEACERFVKILSLMKAEQRAKRG